MTAPKPERPDWVKVGPFVFNITWSGAKLKSIGRVDGMDRFGMSDMEQHHIIIDDNRPLSGLQNTLVHEILHCMVWTYDIPMPYESDEHKMEETYVCRMDSPMLLLLKENPHVVAWLCADGERNGNNGA